MVLYSRTFTITSCDPFTRNFITRLGVILNEPSTVPDDPYTRHRQQVKGTNLFIYRVYKNEYIFFIIDHL